MANGVLFSLRLLAIFVPLSCALYEQDWNTHGVWAKSRSIRKTFHFSCTLPTSVPVDVFIVTVTTQIPFSLQFSETWSLELLSTSEDGSQFIFQSLRKMYPPRIVLHFHFNVFGYLIPSGTCSFAILNERLTKSTSPTTTESLNFIPGFLPGLILPDSIHTSSLTTDFTTSNSAWSPESEIVACIESQFIFPDWIFQYVDDGTTTTPPQPNSQRPLQLKPRSKRFILLPDPESVDPSNFGESDLFPPLDSREKVWLNYTDAMEISMMFFAAQRSGDFEKVPLSKPYQWMRPSGTFHSASDGRDLSGGWYNGNDNVKLTFPMAAATSVLAWGYDTWKDVYVSSGLDEMFKETIKWPLDYFLKSWDPGTQTLYVQIGDLRKDRSMWNRADDPVYTTLWNNNKWPVYSVSPANPGSDVAAEVAAAMALSSLIEFDDKTYSTKLRQTAQEIYQFAKKYPGKYSDSVPVGGEGFPDYSSSGHLDELCFAATVLYNVTGSNTFLSDATTYFSTFENTGAPDFFSWDDKRVACAVMLYKITKDAKYGTYVQEFREKWMSPSGRGLTWKSENGTLRHTANAVFILLEGIEAGVFEPREDPFIYTWATTQIEYILGFNGLNRSYLIGYGDSHVRNPYHKNSACLHPAKPCGWEMYNSEMDNRNILVGALVGGPDVNDFHADNRQNTLGNSVAVDYNAGFQSALAGLQSKKEALRKTCDDQVNGVGGGSWTSESTTDSSFSPTFIIDPEMTQTSSLPVKTPTTPYTTPQPTPIPDKPEVFDYADALRKSILFYAAQRSGLEPDNNPIPWRQWDDTETDTNGGWFDDGSAVKTTKVMASAVTLLGWGALKFKAGYETAGALTDLYDSLRWPLDYFIKIWQSEDESLIQKVGIEEMERAYWSQLTISSTAFYSPERIFLDKTARVGRGAEVVADVATALAIGSVLFKEEDFQYSEKLLTAAKQVYKFATKLDSTFVDPSSVYYSNPGPDFGDEMCVAAWWMYKATQDSTYYNDGMLYLFRNTTDFILDWKNKDPLCQMLIYEHTGSLKTSFLIQQMLKNLIDKTTFTPQGLAWHDHDSLKFAANMAFTQVLAKSYGILLTDTNFYKTQIDYMLGNNDQAFSYQIGYGDRYPRRPHHRASSCPDYMNPCDWSIYNAPWKNPHELIGALVSGPDVNDVYEDVRSNYTMNRVAVEYNAGFQSVLAYLAEQFPLTSTEASSTTTTTTTTTTTATTTTQKVPDTPRRPTTTTTTVQTTTSEIRPKTQPKSTIGQTPTSTAVASTTSKGKTTDTSPSIFTEANVEDVNAKPTGSVPEDQNNQISATISIYHALNTLMCFTFIQLLCYISFL